MESISQDSTLSQLKYYTPAIQVTAAVLGTLAIAIITTQSLSGMALIVLSGAAGVNILALILTTALSCAPSRKKVVNEEEGEVDEEKVEVDTDVNRERPLSVDHRRPVSVVAPKLELPLEDDDVARPIRQLLTHLGSRFGEMIALEATLRKKDRPAAKLRTLEQGFESLTTMLLPLLETGLPPMDKEKLLYRLAIAYNFGTRTVSGENTTLKKYQHNFARTLDQLPQDTPEENLRWFLGLLPTSISLIFDLINGFFTLKGDDLRKQLDVIHLQLSSVGGRPDFAGSKAVFDQLSETQLHIKKTSKKEVIFILRHEDDLDGAKQTAFVDEMKAKIKGLHPKLNVDEDLSRLMPEGLPPNTEILPCPYETSPVTPIVPLMRVLPNPEEDSPGRLARIAIRVLRGIIESLIPMIAKKELVANGIAQAESPDLAAFADAAKQAFPEFLLNAVFLGYPMRTAFKETLAQEHGNIVGGLTALSAGDRNLNDIVADFDLILEHLVRTLRIKSGQEVEEVEPEPVVVELARAPMEAEDAVGEIGKQLDRVFTPLKGFLATLIQREGALRKAETKNEIAALNQLFVDVKRLYSSHLEVRHNSTSRLLRQRQIMAALYLGNNAKVQSLLSEARNEVQRVVNPEARAINIVQGMILSFSMRLLYIKYFLMNRDQLPGAGRKTDEALFQYIKDELDRSELLTGCCSIALDSNNPKRSKAKLDRLLDKLFAIKRRTGLEVALLPNDLAEGVRAMFPSTEKSEHVPERLRDTHVAVVCEKGFLPDNSLISIKEGEKDIRRYGRLAKGKLTTRIKESYKNMFIGNGFGDADPALRHRVATNVASALPDFLIYGFYPVKSPFRQKLKAFLDANAEAYVGQMQEIALRKYDRLEDLVTDLEAKFVELNGVAARALA